jgi:hypothetical protein
VTIHHTARYQVRAPEAGKVKAAIAAFAEYVANEPGRKMPTAWQQKTFRGRQNTKLQYAVLATAALHGGTEPDLLDEVAWWQAGDFWQYALFAAVACIRAAASRARGRRGRR